MAQSSSFSSSASAAKDSSSSGKKDFVEISPPPSDSPGTFGTLDTAKLGELVDPKSWAKLQALGGVPGLVRDLHSDADAGLRSGSYDGTRVLTLVAVKRISTNVLVFLLSYPPNRPQAKVRLDIIILAFTLS